VVVRAHDTLDDLKRKVRIATILGTLQATLTDFKYLNPKWKANCEEERLLGVSLTGVMDHLVLSGRRIGIGHDAILAEWLTEMKQVAITTNVEWAARLGISVATAITCVKPSGTVSQLVNSASGMHARHSQFYVRTVRADVKDPIARLLIDQGVPCEPDLRSPATTLVFSFPVHAPDGCVTREDMTALQQLEHWKLYQLHWCEHKPSITVSVKEHEWMQVGAWVWDNFGIMSGVSFLPYDGGQYKQAPYQEIDRHTYHVLAAQMPVIDWSKLGEYEQSDQTVGTQTLACTAGSCEI
jgi:ribonucleoside-triphosphate reductase